MKEESQRQKEFDEKLRAAAEEVLPEEQRDEFWWHYELYREQVQEQVLQCIGIARKLELGDGDAEKATMQSIVRVWAKQEQERKPSSASHE